jgi:hypothetical protein
LYRELGVMELDNCGMWIDKPLNESDWLTADQCPLPPEVPVDWVQDAGIDPREVYEYSAPTGKVEIGPNRLKTVNDPVVLSQTPSRGPAHEPTPAKQPPRQVEDAAPAMPESGSTPSRVKPETAPKPQWLPAGRDRSLGQAPSDNSAIGNRLTAVEIEEEQLGENPQREGDDSSDGPPLRLILRR